MPYAALTDVTSRLGRGLTPELEQMVEVRLEDAEREILHRIPDLDEQITNGSIAVEDVIRVEAEAVLRLARNPDGYQQETDGNYSYMMFQEIASGVLEITTREWALLGVKVNGLRVLVPTMELPT